MSVAAACDAITPRCSETDWRAEIDALNLNDSAG